MPCHSCLNRLRHLLLKSDWVIILPPVSRPCPVPTAPFTEKSHLHHILRTLPFPLTPLHHRGAASLSLVRKVQWAGAVCQAPRWMWVCSVAPSCLTLCSPTDCSLSISSARQAPLSRGIFQARTLEWVAVFYSRGSSQSRDQTHIFFFFFSFKVTSQVSFLGRRILYHLLQLGSSVRWMLSIRHEMLFHRQLFLSLAITGSLFPYVPYPHHSVPSLLIYIFVQSCTAKGGGWVMDAEQHANSWIICIYSRVQHKRRLYTWTSPDSQHQNQTDYILCSQRWRSSI